MKKLLFVGLLGLVLSLSIANPCMAEDEFTEVPRSLEDISQMPKLINFEELPKCQNYFFVDYDKDGNQDFIGAGVYSQDGRETEQNKLFRNNGDDTFTDVGIKLPSGKRTVAAWRDFDNDGLVDFAIAASTEEGGMVKIFHNNDKGSFTPVQANIINVSMGYISWGDFDKDGYLDLAVLGQEINKEQVLRIYHNQGNGVFAQINEGLPGLWKGMVDWEDHDDDGELDLVVKGFQEKGKGAIFTSKIYHNDGLINGQSQFSLLTKGSVAPKEFALAPFSSINNENPPEPLSPIGGTIYYVDASAPPGGDGTQANPFNTIEQGIYAVSQDGDIVQVLPGVYNEYLSFNNITYNNDYSFTLRGDPSNPSSTIMLGYLVTAIREPNKSFVLDGFTFQSGGLISTDTDLAVTVKNTIIQNTYNWGPFTFVGSESNVYTAPIKFKDVVIKNMLTKYSTMRIQFCSNFSLDRVKIVNNGPPPWGPPGGGAMAILGSTVNINNSLIAHNSGADDCGFNARAGGITATWTTLTITNSTIANNVNMTTGATSNAAPGLDLYAVDLVILNSIVWGNTYLYFPSFYKQISIAFGGSDVSIAYSDIQYGIDGIAYNYGINWLAGNIGEDLDLHNPRFISINNWENDGFSLQSTSPCAGTGISQFIFPNGLIINAPLIDINSNDRPMPTGTQPDMGAYEIDQTAPPPTTWTISGMVTLNGVGLPGIDLYEEGTGNVLATTQDPSGYYEILDLPGGVPITVSPYDVAYTFDPTHRTYTGSTGNQENQDYVATLNTYTISGDITGLQSGNTYLVEVTATGANGSGDLLPVSGTNGSYTFNNVPYGWEGTLSASSVAYDFTPTERSISPVMADVTDQDFDATLKTFTISGTFLDSNSNVLPGWAQAQVNGVDVDPITGAFSFTVNYNVPFTLTPTAIGHDINPPGASWNHVTENKEQNFVGTLQTFTISGEVSGLSVPDNITIIAQGTGNYVGDDFPSTVNPNGTYSTGQVVPYNWTGALIVTSAAYNVTADAPLFNGGPVTDHVTQNYTAELKTFTISGNISGILSPNNPYDITINAESSNNPTYGVYGPFSIIAATDGSYSIPDVPYGWEGTLTASSVAYDFTPTEILVTSVTDDLPGQDFEATLKEYTISGVISNLVPGNTYGVTITAECDSPLDPWYVSIDNIDATDGDYSFTLPYGWQGGLIAKSIAYELKEDPEGEFISPVTEPQEQNYTATLKKITVSGLIFGIPANTNSPPPITIKAECSDLLPSPWYETVIADATDGSYSMLLPYGWDGKLIAQSPVYILVEYPDVTFNPPVTEPQVQDYKVKSITFTISGTVYNRLSLNEFAPMAGVSIIDMETQEVLAVTDIHGEYSFDKDSGWSGRVEPRKDLYRFDPTVRTYEDLDEDKPGEDYDAYDNAISTRR